VSIAGSSKKLAKKMCVNNEKISDKNSLFLIGLINSLAITLAIARGDS
jgi:hypothetical protein